MQTTSAQQALAEFLLARIEDDEARWQRAARQRSYYQSEPVPLWTRLIADLEAKRQIVERHKMRADYFYSIDATVVCCEVCNTPEDDAPCTDLRLLALPYADHPDFSPEWRTA